MRVSRIRRGVLASCVAAGLFVGAAPEAQAAKAPQAIGASTEEVLVDLNQATEQELTAVPGIGPSIAKRIVEFREENGPFRRVEDLLRVRGIGEKSLEKLRAHLKVDTKK